MCLAIPGQIIETFDEGGAPYARAVFAGEVRRISLAFLPDLAVGDYVIVHAGFALTRVPAERADEVLASMRSAGLLEDLAEASA